MRQQVLLKTCPGEHLPAWNPDPDDEFLCLRLLCRCTPAQHATRAARQVYVGRTTAIQHAVHSCWFDRKSPLLSFVSSTSVHPVRGLSPSLADLFGAYRAS